MTKKIYFKLIVFLAIINILFVPNIVATESNQTVNEQNIESVTNLENNENNENKEAETSLTEKSIRNELTEEEIKQIEELNNIIKELVKSIKSKLKTIDEKIENIRTIEEYKTYPAIRLNVDTPIFGLASIVNSKLKIKQDVSATDIAKSYSIRNIIKNNSIKLPDKYIAGIIVSTKDVKFDENISLTDANTSVIKLMQYSKTADNVIEFLNNQTNKIFKGYIDKSKSEKIAEIKRNLNNLNEDLLKQDEKLLSLHILLTSDEAKLNFDKEIENFNNISKKVKENKKKIDNILISDEDLVKVQKDVLELESAMIDYSIELDKSLETANKNIDEKQVLLAIYEELLTRKESLEKIVENSVVKKVVKNDAMDPDDVNNVGESDSVNDEKSDSNTNTDINQNLTDDNVIEESKTQTIEEIKVYDVVSKNILEDIDEEILNVIYEKVKYYIKDRSNEENIIEENSTSNSEQMSSESTRTAEEQVDETEEVEKKSEEKEISKEEKEQIVKDCINLYKEFISKENEFYLDNINYTLKNTTSKTSDLSKYTKSDILNEMRYIYLELPSSLENYLDSTNLNSVIETRSLSNSFNKELNNLLNVYVKVSEIYNELNVENAKKNT